MLGAAAIIIAYGYAFRDAGPITTKGKVPARTPARTRVSVEQTAAPRQPGDTGPVTQGKVITVEGE